MRHFLVPDKPGFCLPLKSTALCWCGNDECSEVLVHLIMAVLNNNYSDKLAANPAGNDEDGLSAHYLEIFSLL